MYEIFCKLCVNRNITFLKQKNNIIKCKYTVTVIIYAFIKMQTLICLQNPMSELFEVALYTALFVKA